MLLIAGIALIASGCDHESTIRSDVAVTKLQAEKTLARTLPPSARNIHYFFFAGGMQDLESYLRFEVDEGQLQLAVAHLIAENDKRMHRTYTYKQSALAIAPSPNPRAEFLPMNWWTPSAIRNGFYLENEKKEAFALQIWVDEDASRIFVYQND